MNSKSNVRRSGVWQQGRTGRMPRTLGIVLFLFLASCSSGPLAAASLDDHFRSVPNADKPWAYWWWLKGNVSESSITSDLEAMKRNGFGGLLMFDARGYHEGHVVPPPSKMEFMSPAWRQMLKHAIAEAHRLGLEVSVNLSSCAGALKGPWEVGDDAPKKLIWTSAEVHGPQRLKFELKRPAGSRFWEVALMAVRHDEKAPALPEKSAGAAPSLSDNWREVSPKLTNEPPALEVVDLSNQVDARGSLVWNAPEGRWTLVRFVCVTMEGHEYDVDILDPKAVEGHFERMGRPILEDAGPLAGEGQSLTHFYSVSWEGAAPTWTIALEKEFEKYRDYELRPWLPVLAGFTVKSRDVSERFLRDYYRTLGDCFMDNFYGALHKRCREVGLKWHSESGGPWDRKLAAFEQADQLAFLGRNDMPQGEFWLPSRGMNRPVAMAAHIYGNRLAATESFTHMQQHWSAYPAILKPRADSVFCDGINHLIWHTFTASPPELGKPGSEYFAGTHINPNVTWWPQAGPFVGYLGRGQFMLRQGRFVADVCTYVGDKTYLHWDRGATWSEKSKLKLPKGYSYDLVNTEVLLSRLSFKEGKLVLPDGMSYRMLVVDLEDEAVPPAALRKIIELAKAGATVVLGQRRPQRAPGLADYPNCDEDVHRLAGELWGPSSAQASRRSLGRGTVLTATPMNEVLQAAGILPDFGGPWNYTHRRAEETDIYFLAGSGVEECSFRVRGKEPELWDPVTGSLRDAVAWRARQRRPDHRADHSPGRGCGLCRLPQTRRGATSRLHPCRRCGSDRPRRCRAQVRSWRKEQMTLEGPWTVQFEPGRGAPQSAVFPELLAWDKHSDEGIRHFSGRATYRKSFELAEGEPNQLVRLQLGEVRCIAQVRLNGKDLGVIWTAPWSVDLTGALKPGRNELEVDVVNTWQNRLIGDAGLPEAKRITKSNVSLERGPRTVKVYQGFSSEDPLVTSGLLGPVRLEHGRVETIPF